ncbi:TPA: hypothetical protein ACGHHJ_004579 [Salmonella enterica subsp. enterica serovar Frintrop]
MSFFRYFRLRIAHQVLCVSYSIPVAIFLTTAFSPFSTWSISWFFIYLMTLMWAGLALYTRDNDRICQLAGLRMIAVRNNKSVIVVRIKHHEKARLGWVMCDVVTNRLPVNCFREVFLAKVAAYQQRDDNTSFSGTDALAEHAELREGGK